MANLIPALLLPILLWRAWPVCAEYKMRYMPGDCDVHGPPLDLLFLVDGSGSLAEKWTEQLRMVTDIVDSVVIKAEATRVAFVHYSGRPVEAFDFTAFRNKEDMVAAINRVRPVRGVTRTASALEFAHRFWNESAKGARAAAPRMVLLLSDGRMTPEPVDYSEAARVHREVYGADMYAFGLGKYLDWNPLVDIVGGNRTHVANVEERGRTLGWFAAYRGERVCESLVPVILDTGLRAPRGAAPVYNETPHCCCWEMPNKPLLRRRTRQLL